MMPFLFDEYCFFPFADVFRKQLYCYECYECYKVSIFEAFKIIDFWKCLPNFLFRDWKLSLLLKSKVGSIISFPVSFHLVLVLSLINCIINSITNYINVNNWTWRNAQLQIYGLLLPVVFPKKFGAQIQKRLIYMCMGKNFHSFYAFEWIIHYLAEEDFLNMHSDFLFNVTPEVWIV